jgi:5-aminopentanamidase
VIIAAAQLDRAPDDQAGALASLDNVVAQARGADLLVLPELALCGYGDPARIRRMAVPVDGDFISRTRALARNARMGLIFGYAERAGDVLYNSALAIGPDGATRGHYRKVNLWGRYERDLFASGSPSPVIPWGPLKLGILICYDLEFPEATRDLVLRGADTLIAISATGQHYSVVPQHLVPARGYEAGCHVIYANWAGVDGDFAFAGSSCITIPNGTALAKAPAHGAAVIRATVKADEIAAWRANHDFLSDRRRGLYRWD